MHPIPQNWVIELLGDLSAYQLEEDVEYSIDVNTPGYIITHNNRNFQIDITPKGCLVAIMANLVCIVKPFETSREATKSLFKHWVVEENGLDEFESRYPTLSYEPNAQMILDGKIIQLRWKNAVTSTHYPYPMLRKYIEIAQQDSIISTYYPFTSMMFFALSRNIHYPYDTSRLPVVSGADNTFVVRLNDNFSEKMDAQVTVEYVRNILKVRNPNFENQK